jgi:hypothetical protein
MKAKIRKYSRQLVLSLGIGLAVTLVASEFSYLDFPMQMIRFPGGSEKPAVRIQKEFALGEVDEGNTYIIEADIQKDYGGDLVLDFSINSRPVKSERVQKKRVLIEFPASLLNKGRNVLEVSSERAWRYGVLRVKNIRGYSKGLFSFVVFNKQNRYANVRSLKDSPAYPFLIILFFLAVCVLDILPGLRKPPARGTLALIRMLRYLLYILFLLVLFAPLLSRFKVLIRLQTALFILALSLAFSYAGYLPAILKFLRKGFARGRFFILSLFKRRKVLFRVSYLDYLLQILKFLRKGSAQARVLILSLFKSRKILLPVLLLLVLSILYTNTMLPGMGYSGDTAKFQFIGKILGIPHATGYPLYILLNKLFIQIPVRSVAFRANLMSVFFSLLTLFFLYRSLSLIFKKEAVSFFSTLFLALSLTYWSQSLVAEVYTLNSFFLALVIFLLVKWAQSRRDTDFYLFLFAYALSFGNHMSMILLLPAILVLIISVDVRIMFRKKSLAVAAGALFLGVGQYAYLFIRTFQNAVYRESEVSNLKQLLFMLTAKPFRKFMFAFPLKEIFFGRISLFGGEFLKNWNGLLIIAGVIGAFGLFRKERKIFWFLFLSFVVQAVYILNYDISDIFVFYIPPFLIFSIFLASGLDFLTKKIGKPKALLFAIYLVLILIAVKTVTANLPEADLSHRVEADLKFTALFRAIPPYSIIIVDNYLDMEYAYNKSLLDFQKKNIGIIAVDLKKDFIQNFKDHLFWRIARKKEWRAYLFPEPVPDLSYDEFFLRIREDKTLRDKIFSHVILLTSEAKEAFEKIGARVVSFFSYSEVLNLDSFF